LYGRACSGAGGGTVFLDSLLVLLLVEAHQKVSARRRFSAGFRDSK
jgi:hypothetical protein